MEKDDGRSVILYKPCGVIDSRFLLSKESDFALGLMDERQEKSLLEAINSPTSIVCADATHGTTKYHIKLVTLMTVNSFGSGVPCGFLFSNKEDETVLGHFFEGVKSRVGAIESKIFMTDDTGAYWNSYRRVMECTKTQRLLCIWHVDKNWRKQLCAKVKDETKRGKLYKQLCLLRLEPDKKNFNQMLKNFISRTNGLKKTKDFGKDFETEYSERTKCWAACHRPQSYINTNMYLESMHKTLKYCVFEKKSIRRLDRAIYLVTVLFDQIYAKFERMFVKPTATKDTSCIFKIHG